MTEFQWRRADSQKIDSLFAYERQQDDNRLVFFHSSFGNSYLQLLIERHQIGAVYEYLKRNFIPDCQRQNQNAMQVRDFAIDTSRSYFNFRFSSTTAINRSDDCGTSLRQSVTRKKIEIHVSFSKMWGDGWWRENKGTISSIMRWWKCKHVRLISCNFHRHKRCSRKADFSIEKDWVVTTGLHVVVCRGVHQGFTVETCHQYSHWILVLFQKVS